MVLQACPSREDLEAFKSGSLARDQYETVAAHTETCPDCRSILKSLLEAKGKPASLASEANPSQATPLTRTPDKESCLGRIGNYVLLAELGHGGMGTVYKARQVLLDKEVALKVLPKERTNDAQAVARFHQEMKAVGRLSHPNIVAALNADEANGTFYLVMELLEGIDLEKLSNSYGPLPLPEACEMVRQAAEGLHHAHECHLVHRDIKPSNLLLTPEGCVKVLDLGLARVLGRPRTRPSEMTVDGEILGTADYLAPEQIEEANKVDARADQYSLGCTLYKLIVGQAPFADAAHDTLYKKFSAHLTERPPSIRSLRPEVSEQLTTLVERLMAKDPAKRFTSMKELIEAIQPFATGAVLPALFSRVRPDLAGTSGSPVPTTALPGETPQSSRKPFRLPWRWMAAVTTTAALLALIIWKLCSPPSSERQKGGTNRPDTPYVKSMRFIVRREGDDQRLFYRDLVGEDVKGEPEPIDPPLTLKDDFKLKGQLNRPAPWALLWFDTAGKVSVVAQQNDPREAVEYPVRPDRMVSVDATDPPGIHLLVLVAGGTQAVEKAALEDALRGVRLRLSALPKRWSLQLRGPGEEREGPPSLEVAGFLQSVRSRLPFGWEPVQLVLLAAKP